MHSRRGKIGDKVFRPSGARKRERGSKCDGKAVTFTAIEAPAALALASAAGRE